MIAALQRYADRSVISLDSPERGVEEMQRCLLQFEIDSNPETRTSLAISVLQSLLPKSGVDNKDLLELFREAVQCWLVGVWCVVLKESGSLGMFDSKTPASFAKAVWYSFIQRSEPSFTRTITDRIKKTVKPSLEEDLPQQNLFQPTAPRLTLNLSKFSLGQSVPLIDSHGIFTRTFESLLHLEMVSNLTTSDHTVVLEVAELCKTEILKCVQILRLHHQASSPLSSSTSSAESTIIIPVESVCGILDSTAVASQPRLPSSSILSIINRARSAMKRHISSCVSFPASLSPDEQSLLQLEIANELALSAIKTQILRYRHDSKIFKWDWKEIESAEGNQGIGIHYAYTRVCGIRRKSGMPWMGEGFLASLEKLEQLNAGLLACSDEAVQLAYDLFKYHSFMFANVLSPDLSVPR